MLLIDNAQLTILRCLASAFYNLLSKVYHISSIVYHLASTINRLNFIKSHTRMLDISFFVKNEVNAAQK